MSAQVFINLDDLIFRAYNLGLNAEEGSEAFTKAQLRNILLADVPISAKSERPIEDAPAPAKTKTTKTKTPVETEKKPRAPAKPRAVPEDDTRCCARAFYEKDHLDGGKLKVMRDDSDNLFGDRCKFKKAEGEFCKHHAEKQPHGIWGAAYDGKFKLYKPAEAGSSEEAVEKPAAAPAKKVLLKKPAPAPAKPVDEGEFDDSSTVKSDDEFYEEEMTKVPSDVELIEINDIDYYVDTKGNAYDPETEEKVGVYSKTKKAWIVAPKF